MLEKYVRPSYQAILVNPIARHIKLPPTLITALSCISGIFAAVAVGFQHPWLALFLLACSGYLDTLDGTVARIRNISTPFGSAFDIFSDRVVEAAMILGLYAIHPAARATVSLAMMTSVLLCITSFLVVGIFTENTSEKSFHYSPGLMQRAEAFIFFTLMMFLPTHFIFLGWLFTSLITLTAIIRLIQFKTHIAS